MTEKPKRIPAYRGKYLNRLQDDINITTGGYNKAIEQTMPKVHNLGEKSSVVTGEGLTLKEAIQEYTGKFDVRDNVNTVVSANKNYIKALNKYNDYEKRKIQNTLDF